MLSKSRVGNRSFVCVSVALVACIVLSLSAPNEFPKSDRPDFEFGSQSTSNPPSLLQVSVGGYPIGLAFDPLNGLLYTTLQQNFSYGTSYNLSSIDPNSGRVVATLQIPSNSMTLAVDTSTGFVYFADDENAVYAVNVSTDKIAWHVSAGCPQGCAPQIQTFDSRNGQMFATDLGDNNLTIVNGSNFVSSFYVGQGPNGAAYDAANQDVYVANEDSFRLSVVNAMSDQLVGSIAPVDGGPGVVYDPQDQEVYTCSNNASNPLEPNFVTAIDGSTNTVAANIPVISSCGAMAYDSKNNYLYVTDQILSLNLTWGSMVTVIDPQCNQVVDGLPVGLAPDGIAFDSANSNVYVANTYSGTVSEAPTLTRVSFVESGLPPGSNWSVAMGGRVYSSRSNLVTFPGQDGAYQYDVAPIGNLTAVPSEGNISLSGGSVIVNVTFVASTTPPPVRSSLVMSWLDFLVLTGGLGAGVVTALVVVVRRKDGTGR